MCIETLHYIVARLPWRKVEFGVVPVKIRATVGSSRNCPNPAGYLARANVLRLSLTADIVV